MRLVDWFLWVDSRWTFDQFAAKIEKLLEYLVAVRLHQALLSTTHVRHLLGLFFISLGSFFNIFLGSDLKIDREKLSIQRIHFGFEFIYHMVKVVT